MILQPLNSGTCCSSLLFHDFYNGSMGIHTLKRWWQEGIKFVENECDECGLYMNAMTSYGGGKGVIQIEHHDVMYNLTQYLGIVTYVTAYQNVIDLLEKLSFKTALSGLATKTGSTCIMMTTTTKEFYEALSNLAKENGW